MACVKTTLIACGVALSPSAAGTSGPGENFLILATLCCWAASDISKLSDDCIHTGKAGCSPYLLWRVLCAQGLGREEVEASRAEGRENAREACRAPHGCKARCGDPFTVHNIAKSINADRACLGRRSFMSC